MSDSYFLSYFISDFDLVYGGLYGIILLDSLTNADAVPIKVNIHFIFRVNAITNLI